jgi:hypothetical protein
MIEMEGQSMIVGYTRVSAGGQTLDAQQAALRALLKSRAGQRPTAHNWQRLSLAQYPRGYSRCWRNLQISR